MAGSVLGVVTGVSQNAATAVTAARTTSAGSVFVALAAYYNGTGLDDTISDSKGNTWTAVQASTLIVSPVRMKAWVCIPSTVGASHTFTVTRGDSSYSDHCLAVIELGGMDTTTLVDSGALNSASTGTSAAPSNTTGTLALANSVVVGMAAIFNAATFTQDAAFTNQAILDNGSDHVRLCVGTKIVSATTAVTYAPTISASTAWAALAIPLRAAAAGALAFSGTVSAQTGTVGTAFTWTGSTIASLVSGGTTPYSYAVTTGTLPAGLSINSSTGVISGTPTTAGSGSVTVSVTDSAGSPATVATNSFSFTISASTTPTFPGPNISNISGTQGTAITSVDVSSKFANATSYEAGGTWPLGLVVSSVGVISGTSQLAGTFTLTVVGRNGSNTVPSNSFTVTMAAAGSPVDIVRTIGTAGDYANAQAWNDAGNTIAGANLATANIRWIGDLFGEHVKSPSTSTDYGVAIQGSTDSATCYKLLRARSGFGFRDHASKNTNPLRYDAAVGAGMRNNGSAPAIALFEQYASVAGLQVKQTGGTAWGIWTSNVNGLGTLENIIYECDAPDLGLAVSGTWTLRNFLYINTRTSAQGPINRLAELTAGTTCINFMAVALHQRATHGLLGGNNAGSGNGTVTSNWVNSAVLGANNFRQFTSPGTFLGCQTDASEGIPSGVTGTTLSETTGVMFQSLAQGSHNLRRKAGSSLIDAGVASGLMAATDIMGNARTIGAAPDVGPLEESPSGGGASSSSAFNALLTTL